MKIIMIWGKLTSEWDSNSIQIVHTIEIIDMQQDAAENGSPTQAY